jgi:hypothetical protein
MGMLGLLITALIICWLVITQMKMLAPAASPKPAAPVKEAAAAAKVDASNYQNMVKDVKTQLNASMQQEAQNIQTAQETNQEAK